MDKKRFDKWARSQVFIERQEEGICLRFVLKHVAQGAKVGSEVLTIDVTKPSEALLEQWATELELAAMQDADGIGGIQSYVVHSYFENNDKPIARFAFRVEASSDDDDGEASEPPTSAGLTAQAMRHAEVLMKVATLGAQQTISTLQRQNSRLSEAMEKMQETHFQQFEAVESLLTQKHKRDLATKKAEHRQELTAAAFEKLAMLVPVILNKMVGKDVFPSDNPQMKMLSTLLGSITREQLEAIQVQLSPEQQVILLDLAGSMQQPEGKPPALMPPSSNGAQEKVQ